MTTKDFSNYWINILEKEIFRKNYIGIFFSDFTILKNDLPYNFNTNEFIDLFKNYFNTTEIKTTYFEVQDLGYKLRIVGKFFRDILHNKDNDFVFNMYITDTNNELKQTINNE